MKKLVVLSTVLAITAAAMICGMGTDRVAAQATPSTSQHKIALIDMAHVFKNYSKFESMRESLKTEITASEEKIKGDLEQLKALQEKLQMLTESSPGYAQAEAELASKAAEIDAGRKVMQRDFLRKESQIYKQVYMEVTGAVKMYAEYYNYTLVLRFNRSQLQEDDAPRDVINGMNKQVVYHRSEDDITDAVLDYLNKKHAKENAAARAPGTNPR